MVESGSARGGLAVTPPLHDLVGDLLGEAAYLGPQIDLEDLIDPDDADAPWSDERWAASVADLLADLLKASPGGVLAAAVQDATTDGRVADLSDRAVVELAAGAQRLVGWAIGRQLVAVAELARRWEHTPGGTPEPGELIDRSHRGDLGHRAAVTEIALASGQSEYAVSARLDVALVLPARLPLVWDALTAGHLEAPRLKWRL